MLDVLSKPLNEIGLPDIVALVEAETPEGEQLEFKETLPSEAGTEDLWIKGRARIGNRAKNSLVNEVVAFANAYGGALLIGVEESGSVPNAAASLKPVPRCLELANHLQMVFRDWVDPELPRLETLGIPTQSDSGVVLIRTGKSRRRPHRVTKSRKSTIRRSDRCEEMSMREIQDMTLNVSRGLQRLENTLTERSASFHKGLDLLANPHDAFGIRVTAAPIASDEIRLDRVYRNRSVIPECAMPQVRLERKGMLNPPRLESPPGFPLRHWRPILRGARADRSHFDAPHRFIPSAEIHSSGLIEIGFSSCSSPFHGSSMPPDWPLVMFAIALLWASRVRKFAQAPTAEYAIDAETVLRGQPIDVGANDRVSLAMRDPGEYPSLANVRFPQYPLTDDDALYDLLVLFERDFWNSIGADVGSHHKPLEIT